MEKKWFLEGLCRLLIATMLVAYTTLSWSVGLLYHVSMRLTRLFRRFVKWLYVGANEPPKHHPRPSVIPTPVYDAFVSGAMLVAGFVYLVT